MHYLLLVTHLLAATIWVGGHLILSLGFLPAAIRKKDPSLITNFEKHYERIGIPALLILVITGISLSYLYNIPVSNWFSFENAIEQVISLKLSLLLFTLILGIHARFFIIPTLSNKSLNKIAFHIILITLTGVTMLFAGSTVRFGGF
jgi:putative copper export protein